MYEWIEHILHYPTFYRNYNLIYIECFQLTHIFSYLFILNIMYRFLTTAHRTIFTLVYLWQFSSSGSSAFTMLSLRSKNLYTISNPCCSRFNFCSRERDSLVLFTTRIISSILIQHRISNADIYHLIPGLPKKYTISGGYKSLY